jgi:hypothetical protein
MLRFQSPMARLAAALARAGRAVRWVAIEVIRCADFVLWRFLGR